MGIFLCDNNPIANMIITDGIIAISRKVAYGIIPNGGSSSKLADTPLRSMISMVNPSSGLF